MVRWEKGELQEYLYEMWLRIFHDTVPYTQFYFNEVYGKNEILLEEKEEQIRGMLHLNPYKMQMGKDTVDAHYIVGVSTEEDFRRQGVMRELLLQSFQTLRERGEAFTYLMPADEAYYLPFGFRFGMQQYEQELDPGKWIIEDKGYVCYRAGQMESLTDYVSLENERKAELYGIATKIDEAYLERLNEEVRSEFGCLFYVEKEEKPMGRFVVYAEDDGLAISQMACYDKDLREEFLQQIIQFCDQRYHFRQYRITFPEDWKDNLMVSDQFGNIRVFQTRQKPIIMFRILQLEGLASWLRAQENVDCILQVTDEQVKEQEGYYHFKGNAEGMTITRVDMKEDASAIMTVAVDGVVDIGDLAARIFGNLRTADGKMISAKEEILLEGIGADEEMWDRPEIDCYIDKDPTEGFTEAAQNFWNKLVAIGPIDIPEIV